VYMHTLTLPCFKLNLGENKHWKVKYVFVLMRCSVCSVLCQSAVSGHVHVNVL
jgi:hypothetical protein